jgi:hypothetical protein
MIHGMPFTNKETREEVLAQVKDNRNDYIVRFASSRKAGEAQIFLRDQQGRETAALKEFQIISSTCPTTRRMSLSRQSALSSRGEFPFPQSFSLGTRLTI